MKKFEGKKVFVTGAGKGIGYDICLEFAKAGAIVGLNDMDSALASEASEKINSNFSEEKVFPYPGNIADVHDLEQKIHAFAEQFGGIHILVANAGITNYGAFLECTPESFDQLTSVNLRGSFFSSQFAAKKMIAQKSGGRIILMSSVTGVQAHNNLAAYGITKAGIRMMAKTLGFELGKYGITVNAVGPGATITERTLEIDPNYEENWNKVAPNQRTARTEDISSAVLFLASDEARHITGQTLMVDGGWTIHSPLPEGGA
ncbi:SDR family NAD(P)-dependent oxidoreductase [Flexithrix dorotheae]|uniref:SDR family NAD(P)-dependent oxidoreductase n=1 Tax=Flexithrix dorotheae TaxID=70993 RepID=UPI0003616048|nr:SDR family NAD(P)-dependent oxidoreductase [Flexithrix dorotheae]